MNVKKLKELIQNLPDDLEIMQSGFDHRYNYISKAEVTKAEFDPNSKKYWKYYGDKNMFKGSVVKEVLYIE